MKIRHLLILFMLCLPSSASAMERQKNGHAVVSPQHKTAFASMQKRLILALTTEDASQITKMLDDDLIEREESSYFEKNMLFLRYCIFVMARKKYYSTKTFSESFEARINRDNPVHKKLDELLMQGKPGRFDSELLSFYLAVFRHDLQAYINHYNTDTLLIHARDVFNPLVLDLRRELPKAIDNEIYCVLKDLKRHVNFSQSDEDEKKLVSCIKDHFKRVDDQTYMLAEHTNSDQVATSLHELIKSLSDEDIKQCIFLLSRPFFENRLIAWNIFFKMYMDAQKKSSEPNPTLAKALFDMLFAQMPDHGSLHTLLMQQKIPTMMTEDKRKKLAYFLQALNVKHAKRLSTDSPQEPAKKTKRDVSGILAELNELDEQGINSKLDALVKDSARASEMQELLFLVIQKGREKSQSTPELEKGRAVQAQEVDALVIEHGELSKAVASLRWSLAREHADLDNQIKGLTSHINELTDLAKKTQVDKRKDIDNE